MKRNYLVALVLLVLIFIAMPVLPASANTAEPPCLTVIVSSPPDDLTMSIQLFSGNERKVLELEFERLAWEGYYRLFQSQIEREPSFEGAVLIVRSSEYNFDCPLPSGVVDSYNWYLTLDLDSRHIVFGQSIWRSVLLVAMRVVLTLLLEGLVFLLFGYRRKASWLAFLVVNLITQGLLNAVFIGPNFIGYWMLALIFGEILIFIAEAIAFAETLKEFGKVRAVCYALTANAASLVLGGFLLSYLPM